MTAFLKREHYRSAVFSILVRNCHLAGNFKDQSIEVTPMENVRQMFNTKKHISRCKISQKLCFQILFVDVLLVTLILSPMTTRICYHCGGIFDIWFLSWTKIKKRFYSITHIQVLAIISPPQSCFIGKIVKYLQYGKLSIYACHIYQRKYL